jgi:hypothetical protein
MAAPVVLEDLVEMEQQEQTTRAVWEAPEVRAVLRQPVLQLPCKREDLLVKMFWEPSLRVMRKQEP